MHSHLGIPKEHIIRYDGKTTDDLAKAILPLTPDGAGFAHAIDLVGGPMKTLCFHLIGNYGHVITIVPEGPGYATPLYPHDGPHALARKSATFTIFGLRVKASSGRREDWASCGEGLGVVTGLIEEGRVVIPRVETVGHLEVGVVGTAHRAMETGHTTGKLVMSIP